MLDEARGLPRGAFPAISGVGASAGHAFLQPHNAVILAGLKGDRSRSRQARDQFAAAYSRFIEGFGTVDLRASKRLLDELT